MFDWRYSAGLTRWWDPLPAANQFPDISLSAALFPSQQTDVLGDPRTALTWLVNELSRHGIALEAGDVVTTGTCVVPIPVEPGVTIDADYGVLGSIRASFV